MDLAALGDGAIQVVEKGDKLAVAFPRHALGEHLPVDDVQGGKRKPVTQGGVRGRKEATGRGLYFAIREACAEREGAISPDEQDLVNSGLEETMITAFHDLLKTKRDTQGVPDLRIAAFLGSIHKIARSYTELGIFP